MPLSRPPIDFSGVSALVWWYLDGNRKLAYADVDRNAFSGPLDL